MKRWMQIGSWVVIACFVGCGSSGKHGGEAHDGGARDAAVGMDASRADASTGVDAGSGSGGDAGDGGTVSELEQTLREYCRRSATAECKARVYCDHVDNGTKQADCIDQGALACERTVPELARVIASGRAVYDATKAATCFAAALGPFCHTNNLDYLDPSCTQIFRSTVAVGETCYAAADYFGKLPSCVPNAVCSAQNGMVGPCPGKCVARLTQGMSCKDSTIGCAEGLYCRDNATCEPFVQKGEPCAGAELCASGLRCIADDDGGTACLEPKPGGADCPYDLACASYSCRDGKCTGDNPEGAPCAQFNADCAEGLVCVGPEADLSAWKCAKPAAKDAPCSVGRAMCANGLTCSWDGSADPTSGTCKPPPAALQVGEACTADSCAQGLYCGPSGADAGSTCQAISHVGGPCHPGGEPFSGCDVGLGCDPDTAKCVRAAGLGEPCRGHDELCARFAYCAADGKCAAMHAWGEACERDGECASSFCDAHVCHGYCFAPASH